MNLEIPLIALASIALINVTAPSRPATTAEQSYVVPLIGEAERNDLAPRGDSDGSGLARLTLKPAAEQICYDFSLSGVATPLMAHVHEGSEMQNGPSVITLFTGPGGKLDDCVPWTEKQLTAIVDDPASFYVNLSTTEFPDGALRGQLLG